MLGDQQGAIADYNQVIRLNSVSSPNGFKQAGISNKSKQALITLNKLHSSLGKGISKQEYKQYVKDISSSINKDSTSKEAKKFPQFVHHLHTAWLIHFMALYLWDNCPNNCSVRYDLLLREARLERQDLPLLYIADNYPELLMEPGSSKDVSILGVKKLLWYTDKLILSLWFYAQEETMDAAAAIKQ